MKNRFKKNGADGKKDFLEYEIEQLNKSLDSIESVDEEPVPPPKGQIPLYVKPSHLYPQKLPMDCARPCPPIVVPPEPPKVPDMNDTPDNTGRPGKHEIPSVPPVPPPEPPRGENGISEPKIG